MTTEEVVAEDEGPSMTRPPEGTCATFQIAEEGHTLGNVLRFMLNKDPNVHLAAYSRPHPSHTFINVRVQTTGQVSAAEALRSASVNVANVCDHIGDTFEQAMRSFKQSKAGGSAPQAPEGSESSSELSSSSGDMQEA